MFKRGMFVSLGILFLGGLATLFVPRHGLVPHHSIRSEKCLAAYRRLYRRDTVDFRVVFGYKDARPARFVGDRYERAYFVQSLIKMGFTRSDSDEGLFTKKISNEDLGGADKTVMVRVVASSVSPDDQANRRDPFQAWQSAHANQVFLDGLAHADGVFYDGHSRDGGGPDFEPPRCRAGEHVNYPWYRKNHRGLDRMLAALRSADEGPKMLGLFSCLSDRHFSRLVLDADRGAGLVVTESLVYYADSLKALTGFLSNLLEMKCESGLPEPGTRLLGFFDPARANR